MATRAGSKGQDPRAAFLRAHSAGRQEDALAAALAAARRTPRDARHWVDAATALVYLSRWPEALAHAERALKLGGNGINLFDALAHIHGALGRWDEVRRHGCAALLVRDQFFRGGARAKPVVQNATAPATAPAAPPPPSPETRARNLIAFSLFGARPRYCEPAVLNAQEARQLYPHWTCRFHVDESVPNAVLERLRAEGAEVSFVQGPARAWPGPMWRLLAADEPGVHRVLFRDADAVVSAREAGAVAEWIDSGAPFHLMRDACTHTELILAGLWGLVAGVLPPLGPMVDRYLVEEPDAGRFADQWFLRSRVWPHVRGRALTHDSVFGAFDARPFPEGPRRADFHCGQDEATASFERAVAWPDGTPVEWELSMARTPLCRYRTEVRNGRVKDQLPRRWLPRLREGSADIELHRVAAEAAPAN